MPASRALIARAAAAAAVAVTLLALPPPRSARAAEPRRRESATVFFDRGAQSYNLGHFEEAIADFERAYQIEPSPILLFNIAQCQRQLGNPERALFLYRRYLEQAPRAPNRADVERRVAELDEQIRQRQQAAAATAERERAARAAASAAPAPAAPVSTVVVIPKSGAGRWRGPWSVDVLAAPSVVWFSGTPGDTPVVFAARLEAAYGILVARETALRLGLDASFAAVPFTKPDSDARATSSLWGVLASARLLARVRPAVALGGGLGAGVLWWSGLADGNPFTVERLPSSGPVALPTLAAELRAEYAFERGLYLVLAPTLFASKTTGQGLSDVTSAVWRFDVSAGAGFTF